MEDSQIAAALCARLAARIGTRRYELWFGPTTQVCVDQGAVRILSTTAFVRDWLRTNFLEDVRACWETIVGHQVTAAAIEFAATAELAEVAETNIERKVAADCEVALDVEDGATGLVGVETSELAGAKEGPSPAPSPERRGGELCAKSVAGFSLAGFEVGPGNEYAFRSAELTARGRQQASPVLWCGSTGVGKTHLLRAIVGEYRRRHRRATAAYLSAEQFTTCFVEALRGSGLPSFRQKCRGADLLAIDDLQFFIGKARTLEELQHTVDTLLSQGRQLVLASDRGLADLRALGPELWSRLAGGLVCEIGPPEFATRLGILRRLAEELRLVVGEDVLKTIAGQITAGARELRGALHRLQAMSAAYRQPITAGMADEALRELARQSTRAVRLVDVEQAVCDVFGVEPTQLRSDRKGRTVSEPRMLAMWLARKYTRMPWSEIGHFFGRRSHSTVIAAHRRVERLITAQAEVGLNDRPCGVEEAIRRLERALRTA